MCFGCESEKWSINKQVPDCKYILYVAQYHLVSKHLTGISLPQISSKERKVSVNKRKWSIVLNGDVRVVTSSITRLGQRLLLV